jgi:hypothetical protein
MFTDVKKKTQKKFDVTILTQVVIGILDLWNASTYLDFFFQGIDLGPFTFFSIR